MNIFLDCLIVGAGGAMGAIGRYLMGLLPLRHSGGFPTHTFLINVTGAFVIGLVTALAEKELHFSPQLKLFLTVGVCGGFTTFSTFSNEAAKLLQGDKPLVGVLYVILSITCGVLAIYAAQRLVR